MLLKFKDLEPNKSLVENASIYIVYSEYGLFIDLIVDKVKYLCKGNIELEIGDDLADEYGIEKTDSENEILNNVNIKDFLECVKIKPISGLWYCKVSSGSLTKLMKGKIEEYFKKPSKNGKLVYVLDDIKDYIYFVKSFLISKSKDVILFNLNYPNKYYLKEMLKEKFESISIEDRSLDLFILRMGNDYDKYMSKIDIIKNNSVNKITYEDVKLALSNVESYVVDDFVIQIIKKSISKSKKINKSKIYSMFVSLKEELGIKVLHKKVLKYIETLIEMRIAINLGIIPYGIKFSLEEVQKKLDNFKLINNMNEYMFRKNLDMAFECSLIDLKYISMILTKVSGYKETTYIKDEKKYKEIDYTKDEKEYEKAFIFIILRMELDQSVLNNKIGIDGKDELYDINKTSLK